MPATRTSIANAYADGYAEGRRSAICMVVPLADSSLYADSATNIQNAHWDSHRAYWIGLRRGLRLHWDDAYQPTVLAARARRRV